MWRQKKIEKIKNFQNEQIKEIEQECPFIPQIVSLIIHFDPLEQKSNLDSQRVSSEHRKLKFHEIRSRKTLLEAREGQDSQREVANPK